MNDKIYGVGDSTFQAAGGEQGIHRLVNSFYDIMNEDPIFRSIRGMHPQDSSKARDKLALFLCGWMGGPKLYQSKYGEINIPLVHKHLGVTLQHKNLWLDCMAQALARQSYPSKLVEYLQVKLEIPAEFVRLVCERTSPELSEPS